MFTLRDIARSHMDSDIRIAIYWRSDLAEVWLSAGFGWAEIKSREWRLLTRDEAFGGDGVAIARQRMPRVAAVARDQLAVMGRLLDIPALTHMGAWGTGAGADKTAWPW